MSKKFYPFSLLFLCLMCLSNQKAQAQDENTSPNFRFGLKISPGFHWIKPDNKWMENSGAKLGFSYGLMAEKRIQNNYSFLFGVDVNTFKNGVRYVNDLVPETFQNATGEDSISFAPGGSVFTYKYGVINLPIALKMSTNQIGYMKYFGQFGFELGMRYKTEADVEYNWNKSTAAPIFEELEAQDRSKFFRLGLVLGGGLEWNLSGNTNLLLGITYHNGFTNVFSKKYTNAQGEKVENKTVLFDDDGNLIYDSAGNIKIDGKAQKAYARYVAFNVGFFF